MSSSDSQSAHRRNTASPPDTSHVMVPLLLAAALATPSEPVPATRKPVPAPRKPVPAPRVSVPATRKPVPAPRVSVPATSKPVPAPRKPVPAPRKPVPAPRVSVPATSKPVPAPRVSVPAPRRPVPAPRVSVPATRKFVLSDSASEFVPESIHVALQNLVYLLTEKTNRSGHGNWIEFAPDVMSLVQQLQGFPKLLNPYLAQVNHFMNGVSSAAELMMESNLTELVGLMGTTGAHEIDLDYVSYVNEQFESVLYYSQFARYADKRVDELRLRIEHLNASRLSEEELEVLEDLTFKDWVETGDAEDDPTKYGTTTRRDAQPPLCRYDSRRCALRDCTFRHEQPRGSCRFGKSCRFGASCRFIHPVSPATAASCS
jgi:hypothetical protein